MIGFFNDRKKKKLIKQINALINSDECREYKGLQKDTKDNYVGVVVCNCLPLIKVELYHSNGKRSALTSVLKDGVINIGDIQVDKIDLGCGSLAMQALLDFAKEHRYSKITGWLSPVDRDHFDRLEHFYRKFGFNVEFNSDRTEGSISLDRVV